MIASLTAWEESLVADAGRLVGQHPWVDRECLPVQPWTWPPWCGRPRRAAFSPGVLPDGRGARRSRPPSTFGATAARSRAPPVQPTVPSEARTPAWPRARSPPRRPPGGSRAAGRTGLRSRRRARLRGAGMRHHASWRRKGREATWPRRWPRTAELSGRSLSSDRGRRPGRLQYAGRASRSAREITSMMAALAVNPCDAGQPCGVRQPPARRRRRPLFRLPMTQHRVGQPRPGSVPGLPELFLGKRRFRQEPTYGLERIGGGRFTSPRSRGLLWLLWDPSMCEPS